MIIAVSTDGTNVSPHFGRCDAFSIFEISEGRALSKKVVQNPGHEPGVLPEFLSKLGVTHVIAGGMGPRAQQMFDAASIKSVTGAAGNVDGVVRRFLSGELEASENACDHEEHQDCTHHDRH